MFGLMKSKFESLYVDKIDELVGKVEIIDIREPYEVKSGTIRTAKNIPMGNLLGNPGKYLLKDKTYYILCHSGGRSRRACNQLEKEGYNVINLSGGMMSYRGSKRK